MQPKKWEIRIPLAPNISKKYNELKQLRRDMLFIQIYHLFEMIQAGNNHYLNNESMNRVEKPICKCFYALENC